MHRAAIYRLVEIDIPVADLDVEAAVGVGAYPGLIVYCCTLAAVIGQRYEHTGIAL